MKKRAISVFIQYRGSIVFCFYTVLLSISFYAAFLLRFDFNIPDAYLVIYYSKLPVLLTLKLIALLFFNLYSGMWRYVNSRDVWNIAKANALALFIFAAVEGILFRFQGFPRSVLILDGLLSVFFMAGARIATRLLREHFSIRNVAERSDKKVLIVGAGDAGFVLFDEYQRNPGMGTVAGFIDDDRFKQKANVQGVKVLGFRQDIPKIV